MDTHAASYPSLDLATLPPGRRLRVLRVAAGLTVRGLAARAAIDPARLSEVERDLRRPRPDQLARLCAALGGADDARVA